jgi:hypothetical protein
MPGRTTLVAVLLSSLPLSAAELKPRKLDGFTGVVYALSFSPDGKRLAAEGGNGDLCVWDVGTGRMLWRQATVASSWGVAFAPDGKTVAVPGNTGNVILYDAASGKNVANFAGHTGTIWMCCFSPDGKYLASSATDNTARIWDVAKQKELQQITGPSGPWSVAFSPDGRRLAIGFDNGDVTTYDTRTWKEERTWQGAGAGIWSMAFSADSRTLGLTGWQNANVQVFEVATGTLRDSFDGGTATGWCVAFTADGAGLKVGGTALTVRDPFSGRKAEAKGTPMLHAVAVTRDGRFAAAGDMEGGVWIWDIAELRKGLKLTETKMNPGKLADHWATLTEAASERAFPAARALAADPAQSLPFLRDHLKPAPAVSDAALAGVEKLVKQLDDDDFETREKASVALEKLGPGAAPALRIAVGKTKSAEVRRRLQTLLDRWEKIGLNGDDLRALRAIEVLEYMNTPEARRILEALAKGADAPPTRDAAAALERINRK